MASKEEVDAYLQQLRDKIRSFDILYWDDRGNNSQALADLEITPDTRREIIEQLKPADYSQGPLEEKMHDILPMWVFGKEVKSIEIYIKISMGGFNRKVICISFHKAEHIMHYPYKSI